ncbi:MAG TPA: HAMP domain-containing histidine kinase [Phycisphaerales bacterium]|nr:HAMP domain-containing histidine kinase [Phycisphaerales bacterium]
MGLRLRGQLMILCFGLIGLSLGIIAYFNVGVFRLSFLADEEQRLRAAGLRAGRRIMEEVVQDYISSNGQFVPVKEGDDSRNFDFRVVPGLRYFELLDKSGRVIMRSGQGSNELPKKNRILERIRLEPLPTHLFYDSRIKGADAMSFPYRDGLPMIGVGDVSHITYEHFYPIFLVSEPTGADLSNLPPATFQAVLHLSFTVENTSKRMRLVTAGNVLLGVTFLLTTLMAIHLWSQHAIQRPLEGLVLSMRQLETGPTGRELTSHNELANISKTLQVLALDRLKYQRELESLNRDLEAQVEAKTQEMKEFFSLVTHDLRIPLAAVQGYCDLLMRKPDQLSERQLTFVNRIATANGHSLELVRNLLEAMKIEFGTMNPVMENFDLCTLAEEVRDELNVDDTLPSVVLEPLDEESKVVTVEADRTRIKRVLTNLLSNAQKHAEGTPQVTLRWKKIPRRGVRVQVVDEGPGIPAEECRRVFEKFTRAPQSMGNSTGLGLGLYIVGKILESHNQSIELKSEVGKGTMFEFNLATVDKD